MNVFLTDVNPRLNTATTTDVSRDSADADFGSMMQINLDDGLLNKPLDAMQMDAMQTQIIDADTENLGSMERGLMVDFWAGSAPMGEAESMDEAIVMIPPMDGRVEALSVDAVEALSVEAVDDMTPTQPQIPMGWVDSVAIGESLPAKGQLLPSMIEPSLLTEPMPMIPIKVLQQDDEKNLFMQNMLNRLNVNALDAGAALPEAHAGSAKHDFLDQSAPKLFESLMLQQMAADTANARLQAAMDSVNGLQHSAASSISTGSASTGSVVSASVLPTGFERMTMVDPENSAEWSHRIGERVSLMLNQNQNAATIRVDPPMLGKIEIQIQLKDDVTHVMIHTQHAQTRDMVDGASYRLREFLQDAGYQNVNVDVSHDSDQQKHNPTIVDDDDTNPASGSEQAAGSAGVAMPTSVSRLDSLVDYFV